MKAIAVLYQSSPPPSDGGLRKPPKPGGYRDSGADIAYALKSRGHRIIVPQRNPDALRESDWVFPDTREGIARALDAGAEVLWTNTVLYPGHPIDDVPPHVGRIGQTVSTAARAENKDSVNRWLSAHGFAVPTQQTLTLTDKPAVDFPFVMKPIRGRGSEGVQWIDGPDAWARSRSRWDVGRYGPRFLVEEALTGAEITAAVMPPGDYVISGRPVRWDVAWALSPVMREGQRSGIMPYSGDVPVIDNSRLVEHPDPAMTGALYACALVGSLLRITAPIRIDARQDSQGRFRLFDVNMKPNLTGPGRPRRDRQQSLVGLAAEGVGWTYPHLVENVAAQWWAPDNNSDPAH